MKRLLRSNLTPGMIVGEDVFSYANQLIIPKGMVLTDKIITRLEFYSIPYVKVKDNPDEPFDSPVTYCDNETGTKPEPVLDVPQKTSPYSELIKSSPEFIQYKTDFDQTINEFKSSMNDIVQKGAKINTDTLLKQATHLIDGASNTASFFNMLHNMRQYDDLTFAHCMNVALISNILATWLNLSQKEIETATLCGLLHDIGKLAIPDQLIKKPGKLTDAEYKTVKTHTIEGYNILKKQDISDHIKNAALMHHEKCDGSGYPFGLKGDKIDAFAKIVAIADVYDAMTAARVYRGPLCPFQVIEIFEKEGLQKYEAAFILKFLENVVNTYMNNRVMLSDGTEGDIVYINHATLSKPMIKTENGFVDLSQHPELSIEKIL
ncbi:MAG: HD-GYP domain-containing protein [Lachnospiraceae bacterium]|nr:HD-GYP domain-containing protein [Lachnospiraceae bacterium]